MAKKTKTDFEKVWDLFMEDFNDGELTERYDNFKNTVKSLKDRYNEKVPAVNEALKTRATLNDMILTCAKMGIVNHEAVEKDKEIQKFLDDVIPTIDDLKSKWEYEEALIKKYEEKMKMEDFKKLPKGSSVMYLGSKYSIENNDGFILSLKNLKTGDTKRVNFSMFNHGGALVEPE
jgi:hypothetical protein